ncbi:MAG TPA: T9SS type A sorting domain-containing protein [Saprospiraceae bacterium]|nr:T9SS type A sorting domain-containing protein [Saprospiraceae bacterium]
MKSKFYFLVSLLSMFYLFIENINAQSPNWVWAKALGGVDGYVSMVSISLDPSGNGDIYAAGNFYGTVDFDPGVGIFNLTSMGYSDIFILKLNNNGDLLWAKSIGSGNVESVKALAVDPKGSGSIIFTGLLNNDVVDFDPGPDTWYLYPGGINKMYICKMDNLGNLVWAFSMEGDMNNGTFANSIIIDPAGSGDFYISGEYSGTNDFDPYTGVNNLTSKSIYDVFICKYNSVCSLYWAKSLGGTNNPGGYGGNSILAIDPIGNENIYVSGNYSVTADFDPGPSLFSLTPAGYDDIFITKLTSSGDFVWAKSMGGLKNDEVKSIAFDQSASGNIYTTGYFSGTSDFDPSSNSTSLTAAGNQDIFISKLDGLGNFVWAKAIGVKNANCLGGSILLDPNGSGNIYGTGIFSGTVDFDPGAGSFNLISNAGSDIYVIKLDGSGNLKWAKSAGGLNNDGVGINKSIDIDISGNLNVMGSFKSQTISFGLTNLTWSGTTESNGFIAKLESSGTATKESNLHPITIYPNPSKDKLILKFTEGQILTYGITIRNILGQIISYDSTKNFSGEIIIDINSLINGIYNIEINLNGIKLVKMFVKE